MTTAPGILAALADLALYDDVELTISRQKGGRLNVTIRRTGEDPIAAVGHLAALDAKLPSAIEEYSRWLEKGNNLDDVEIRMPGTRTAKPSPAKRAPAKKAPAPKKKPAPKKPAAKAPLPDKAACIADYRAAKAKHGAKLTRNLFVRVARTSRRYEALWANCWPDFVKEAEAGQKPAATPPAAKKPSAPKKPAPVPKKPASPAPAADKKDARPKPWRVIGKDNKDLGVTVLEKKVGDTYNCAAGTFEVVAVDAAKREVRVDVKRATETPTLYAVHDEAGNKIGGTLEKHDVGDLWSYGSGSFEVVRCDHMRREYIVRSRDTTAAPAATTAPTEAS